MTGTDEDAQEPMAWYTMARSRFCTKDDAFPLGKDLSGVWFMLGDSEFQWSLSLSSPDQI